MIAKIELLAFLIPVILISCCVEQPIGGERDEHGCLGPAGYTWNESVGACIREWELNDNQKQAAELAVDYVGYEKGLTIIEVNVARCPGCFVVNLEKGKDRIDVTIENWEVTRKSLTPDECKNVGGRTVNIVGEATCEDNETNIGNVTGFISPNICCVASLSSEQACINSGGTVGTSLCCLSTDDFPNLCLIGACGCAPTSSHEVKICDCGEGKCFDGDKCV